MLTPQIKAEGGNGSVGLAFFLGMENSPDAFGHNGADEGFQALLVMFADSGRGIAIMGNSDAFFRVAPYVENAVRQARGWKGEAGPNSPGDAISLVLAMKGTDAALDVYARMKQGVIPGYGKTDESTLNQLGYNLLAEKRVDEAVKAFKLNVQEYPKFWNCYDSLGEAYMVAGQKELAVQNYEKSIELNPDNKNGIEILKKLKGN
jgi:tetratricopeptide (TPR) repeat protein